ncbi:MAG: transcriptional regulator [Candidatus Wildermuthbacteria bacterium RIFCSPLOWO2_01_FULL_48_29]|uniref:Transcriptional regulator n=2 Tax=Parcubacteria group TaxID=1794811 RepID=A0A1G2RK34_9BACT|nr:MAG: transcriptional regulator [Candidatus Yanofskybacteria bacterium RIFCSPHIGHO2_01_FULL_48_25b]OHA73137.1 MAG: transcriptional regulator [Candidatus Wildermuthbacteria bacterium RIFCSPLOWO2_01_FULL_48_29]
MESFKTLKAELLRNPKIKKAYDELGPEFEFASMLIKKRIEKGLTQGELARKVGTKQSAISRLESGGYNPSLALLKKVAKALNADVKISIR